MKTFVDEIMAHKSTNIDLLKQAAESIAIIEAEKASIESCSVVAIKT